MKDGLAVLCTQQACPAGTLQPHIQPFMNYTPLNFFGIIFCMMVGTASLPHILMRYFTTPSVREARQSVAWSLLFIFLLYFSAPAYAAFSKLEVYTNIIGANIDALAVDIPVGRARTDPDLRQECSDPADRSSMRAKRSPVMPASSASRTSSSTRT